MKKSGDLEYDREFNKNLRLLLALITSLGILSIFIYGLSNWTNQTQPQTSQPTSVDQSSQQNDDTINCAQKINQDDAIALNNQTDQNDCLYLGCSEFFQ